MTRAPPDALPRTGPHRHPGITDPSVVTALKLNDDQQSRIKEITAESAKEMREAFAGGGGGDFKGRAEKIATMRKESLDKAQEALSADQKKTWTAMIGEPFKLEQNFGGGDFGKKKKAAE